MTVHVKGCHFVLKRKRGKKETKINTTIVHNQGRKI